MRVPSFLAPPPLCGIIAVEVELHLLSLLSTTYQLNQPTRVSHPSSCHHPSVVLQLPLPVFLCFPTKLPPPTSPLFSVTYDYSSFCFKQIHIGLFISYLQHLTGSSLNGEQVLATHLSTDDRLLVILARVAAKDPSPFFIARANASVLNWLLYLPLFGSSKPRPAFGHASSTSKSNRISKSHLRLIRHHEVREKVGLASHVVASRHHVANTDTRAASHETRCPSGRPRTSTIRASRSSSSRLQRRQKEEELRILQVGLPLRSFLSHDIFVLLFGQLSRLLTLASRCGSLQHVLPIMYSFPLSWHVSVCFLFTPTSPSLILKTLSLSALPALCPCSLGRRSGP